MSKPSHKLPLTRPDSPADEAQDLSTFTVPFFYLQLVFSLITAYKHALTTKTLQQTNVSMAPGEKCRSRGCPTDVCAKSTFCNMRKSHCADIILSLPTDLTESHLDINKLHRYMRISDRMQQPGILA